MSSRADLESKTVPELKQICKDCDVKGYSKLAKDALIVAILEKKGQGTNLEQSLARSTSKVAPDPATEQLLQRTSTKVVYSRDESEARIEKKKDLVAKRAEVSGVAATKATDSEAGAQLVKATTTKGSSKQHVASGTSHVSNHATSTPANLASTLSNARDGQVNPAPAEAVPVPVKKSKLVVQTSQIQKTGSPPVKHPHDEEQERTIKPVSSMPEPAAQPSSKKQAKASASTGKIQKATSATSTTSATTIDPATTAPAGSTVPAKLVVSTGKIQKVTPTAPSTTAPPEPKETRFLDLPADDRDRAFKNVSKNVQKLLKLRKPDFLKKKAKELEKYLELLEVEKGRFTVYRPTDKALRGFMDESIALINQVKEEQLNQLEQEYITRVLPTIIKKNEKNIKKTIARIDRYYTDMDAARDLVEKYIKKAPFPSSYLITVILQKIRDKAL